MKKTLEFIRQKSEEHWVGNGFLVQTLFSYQDLAYEASPFLMMDYAPKRYFPPTDLKKGVGEHPHRGFETVTIVYAGEIEHRDSSGGGGIIKEGDVQWMTAASGLVHEEFHGSEYAKKGGEFQMVQLWVNLPRKFKMTSPRYQGIDSKSIPVVKFDHGNVRIIAGEVQGTKGVAKTYSTVELWDIRFLQDGTWNVKVRPRETSMLLCLEGEVEFSNNKKIKSGEIAFFSDEGDELEINAKANSKLLYLGGEKIREEVAGYGPFVMNTMDEIRVAITDYQSGKMGHLK